jgi:hypothetical protein
MTGKSAVCFLRESVSKEGKKKIIVRFENRSGDPADSIDFQAPATGNALSGCKKRGGGAASK